MKDGPLCLVKFLFKKRKLSAPFTYLFQSYIWLLSIGHDSNMDWMIESCPYQTEILRNKQDSIRSKTFLQNHSQNKTLANGSKCGFTCPLKITILNFLILFRPKLVFTFCFGLIMFWTEIREFFDKFTEDMEMVFVLQAWR